MAEKENTTFESDPLKFCQSAYEKGKKRIDNLAAKNLDNRRLYEGYDPKLEDRANDKLVQRSSLFMPLLRPAIDTRRSDVLMALNEREEPVTADVDGELSNEAKTALGVLQTDLNRVLRESGYLDDGFNDQTEAAEIYASPSVVKLDWEEVFEKEAEISTPTEEELIKAQASGKVLEPQVIWKDKYKGGRLVVELLAPEEFYYEERVSTIRKMSVCGHIDWQPWSKIEEMATEGEWDMKEVRKCKVDVDALESSEADNNTGTEDAPVADHLQDDLDTSFEDGYKDGKCLIVENWISVVKGGKEQIWKCYVLGNKYLVKREKSNWEGIKFPFVAAASNKLPETIECMSSVEIGKPHQRLYSEIGNMFIDAESYAMFSPTLIETGVVIKGELSFRLGAIWRVSDIDKVRPFLQASGRVIDLPILMNAIKDELYNILNSHDIAQGFQTQEYEKATSTRLRASGAAKRALPLRKKYGGVLLEVAEIALKMMQQKKDGFKYVLPVTLDVPSLTSVTDPETDKQEAMLLVSQAQESPIYATPTGQRKLRNLYEAMVRQFKKSDALDFVPSAEEFEADMKLKAGMENAMLKKQEIQETIGLTQGATDG